MKRNVFIKFVIFTTLVLPLDSCVSLKVRLMTLEERTRTQVLGAVSTKWISFQIFHIPP